MVGGTIEIFYVMCLVIFIAIGERVVKYLPLYRIMLQVFRSFVIKNHYIFIIQSKNEIILF